MRTESWAAANSSLLSAGITQCAVGLLVLSFYFWDSNASLDYQSHEILVGYLHDALLFGRLSEEKAIKSDRIEARFN